MANKEPKYTPEQIHAQAIKSYGDDPNLYAAQRDGYIQGATWMQEKLANAKLISAAPELLEACQTLMDHYETKGQLLSFDVDIIRQAIQKALTL